MSQSAESTQYSLQKALDIAHATGHEGDKEVIIVQLKNSSVRLAREVESLILELRQLRKFHEAVMSTMYENAGNLHSPYAYILQKEWDRIKIIVS